MDFGAMERIYRQAVAQTEHVGQILGNRARWAAAQNGLADTGQLLRQVSGEVATAWPDAAGDLFGQNLDRSAATVRGWQESLASADLEPAFTELATAIERTYEGVAQRKEQYDALIRQVVEVGVVPAAMPGILARLETLVAESDELLRQLEEQFGAAVDRVTRVLSTVPPTTQSAGGGGRSSGGLGSATPISGGAAASPDSLAAALPDDMTGAATTSADGMTGAASPGDLAGASASPGALAGGVTPSLDGLAGGAVPAPVGLAGGIAPSPVDLGGGAVPSPVGLAPSALSPVSSLGGLSPVSSLGGLTPIPAALGGGPAGSSLRGFGAINPVGAAGGAGAGIPRAARPVTAVAPVTAAEAPPAPPPASAGASGTTAAAGTGRFFPPIMPFGAGGAGASGRPQAGDRDRAAGGHSGRRMESVPGVPDRLRGRSRPLDGPPAYLGAPRRREDEERHPLDEELWQVRRPPTPPA